MMNIEFLVNLCEEWWTSHNEMGHTGPHHFEDYKTHCEGVALYVASKSTDDALNIAALLHDVAKPRCHLVNKKGGNSFFAHGGHQNLSEEEINYFLGERKEEPTFKEAIELVRFHMDMFFNPEKDEDCIKMQTLKAEKGDEFFSKLCLLNEADIAASRTDHPNDPIEVRLARARERGYNV